jgi:hypothetical protein
MGQENFDTLLHFFKVLGNESRLKILGLLANEERSVGELAVILGVKEPTISHHLAMMKELGLVDVRAAGNERIYWLDGRFLEGMSRDIFSQNGLATLVDEVETADAWDSKVLKAFVEDNRLTAIPSKLKKRLVILKWLAEKFEMGQQYPEAQVNGLLAQYHPDYASLRRYLITEGFMQREKGVYWRVEQ